MSATSDRSARALAEVPDLPRWVEARALLLSEMATLFGEPGGWVIRNGRPEGRVRIVVGRPARADLEASLAVVPVGEILCAPEDADATAELLGESFASERVWLHRLPDAETLAPVDPRVRPLSATDSLAHLTADLRREIESARAERTVHAAFDDGLASSFAYAYWQTESLFDISVDTRPDARRRGLARVAVSALIRHESTRGRRPVWGALAGNIASHRLARGLGFERCDEIVVFTRR